MDKHLPAKGTVHGDQCSMTAGGTTYPQCQDDQVRRMPLLIDVQGDEACKTQRHTHEKLTICHPEGMSISKIVSKRLSSVASLVIAECPRSQGAKLAASAESIACF